MLFFFRSALLYFVIGSVGHFKSVCQRACSWPSYEIPKGGQVKRPQSEPTRRTDIHVSSSESPKISSLGLRLNPASVL